MRRRCGDSRLETVRNGREQTLISGGDDRIRTCEGLLTLNGLANRRLQPLGHISATMMTRYSKVRHFNVKGVPRALGSRYVLRLGIFAPSKLSPSGIRSYAASPIGRGARRNCTGSCGAQQTFRSFSRSCCIDGCSASEVRTSRKILAACSSFGSDRL